MKQFFSGSAVMIIGANVTNVINYIYHLVMGRILGPVFYGELAALFSLIGLLGVVGIALNLVVIKYVSSAKTESEIDGLIKWFSNRIFLLASIIFILISVASPLLASFLKIGNFLLVVLVAATLLFSLLLVVNRAALQGLLSFNKTVITMLLENGMKLLLGVGFVLLGFSVGGAMVGLVIAAALGYLLSRHFLRFHFQRLSSVRPNTKQITMYGVPVFLQSIAITSLYSTDLILVKHFFNPHEAGLYAAISTLGKIIYFGAGPISMVMFPMVSKKHTLGESHRKVLVYSLAATLLLALGVLGFFTIFPQFAIKMLYGPIYLEASSLLVPFGIFMTLFTLSVFFINYYLSLKQTKIVILPILAAVAQFIGIWLFHHNLISVIMVSMVSSAALFSSLAFYAIYKASSKMM